MLAGAFFVRQLENSNFKYPFEEPRTPFRYAYKLTGKDELAMQHKCSILNHEGGMSSFNIFMNDKIGKIPQYARAYKSLGL